MMMINKDLNHLLKNFNPSHCETFDQIWVFRG